MIDNSAVQSNASWVLTLLAPVTNWIVGLGIAAIVALLVMSLMQKR